MKTLTLVAMSVILLVILFQCCPCTALQLPGIVTPTMSVLQSVRATLTAEALAIPPQPTPTNTLWPSPQPTATDTPTSMVAPTSPTLPTPAPTPTPTPVPTFTPVAIGPIQLDQFGTYGDLSISVLWREWTGSRWSYGDLRLDAEPGHHILWIHVRGENRSASPVYKLLFVLFELWHQGRQVSGVFAPAPEGDPHQPPLLECVPYDKMNPGEVCEGWLYFFPDILDDWSREDLLVSYGMSCDSGYHEYGPPPCLYWRFE